MFLSWRGILLTTGVCLFVIVLLGLGLSLSTRAPVLNEEVVTLEEDEVLVAVEEEVTTFALKTLSEVRTAGFSEAGREILSYQYGTGENCIFLFAAIHGSERGGKDLLTKLGEEIDANRDLIDPSNKLVLLPLANPDGYYDREDKLNANGVNLNRNFATSKWSSNGEDETFSGEEAFSEKESQMIRDLSLSCNPVAMISFHAKGGLVSPELNDKSKTLANWYSWQTGYQYYADWDFEGTATKWFAELTGNAAITVELTSYDGSDWKMNRRTLVNLISQDVNLLLTDEL
jgi:hypothetical protein